MNPPNAIFDLSYRETQIFLEVLHREYVRLLTINLTSHDEDERADAANDGMEVEQLRDRVEQKLIAVHGQEWLAKQRSRLDKLMPFPKA